MATLASVAVVIIAILVAAVCLFHGVMSWFAASRRHVKENGVIEARRWLSSPVYCYYCWQHASILVLMALPRHCYRQESLVRMRQRHCQSDTAYCYGGYFREMTLR